MKRHWSKRLLLWANNVICFATVAAEFSAATTPNILR